MGILLFVLEYMYISLLLKMINGFSWPGKIMASPFNISISDFQLILLDHITYGSSLSTFPHVELW